MDREVLLDHWLRQIFKSPDFKRLPLANDASLRRYYRIHYQNESFVVMDAPPPESPQLFCDMAKLLAAEGLTVPKILASDFNNGFLLLSDLGDRLYLNELNSQTVFALYNDAYKALIQMQGCKAALQPFDSVLLNQQLEVLFKGWYLNTHLKVDSYETLQIDPVLDHIVSVITTQPTVFIHRDYHSRNLMIVDSQSPGILDFQDALIGPITYDLVSLLQDCYISWPRDWVEDWVYDFQQRLVQAGLLDKNITKTLFLRWFDFTGLQRHLKNLGIFSRKWNRDNNPNYLKDLPMPLKYIREGAARYPELETLALFFEKLNIETLAQESHPS